MKRKYGWKPEPADFRDKLYRAIRPTVGLPEKADLRPGMPPIVDQGQLGSCTANALAGATEFAEIKNGAQEQPLSRLFIYYNERSLEGDIDQDNGAQIRTGIKTLNQQGVCSEALWPYDISRFKDRPDDVCQQDALSRKIVSYHRLLSLDDILVCLADGFPLCFGISVYESFESDEVAKTGIVPMPGKNERMLGGHALLMVGFDQSKEQFIFRNSWGMWGDKGYGYLPFDYVRTLADDLWTVRK